MAKIGRSYNIIAKKRSVLRFNQFCALNCRALARMAGVASDQ
jgi:hypothetical protein